jgi:hypothetical protein
MISPLTALRSDSAGYCGLNPLSMRICPVDFRGDGWYKDGQSLHLVVKDGELIRWWTWYNKDPRKTFKHVLTLKEIKNDSTDGSTDKAVRADVGSGTPSTANGT